MSVRPHGDSESRVLLAQLIGRRVSVFVDPLFAVNRPLRPWHSDEDSIKHSQHSATF